MKVNILGTGLSGLVGSRIVELLSPEFKFEDLSYETGIDITDKDEVIRKISQSTSDCILHMAAKTDVEACEHDKTLGEVGSAWKINVKGTKNIVEAAQKNGKRVLYISTDFVFSGRQDYYTEDDIPDPQNWYGVTKYEGENIVLEDPKNLVVRITYPYRSVNTQKKDFVHVILDKLKKREKITAITDQIFSPTFIDDISEAIKILIRSNSYGIFHVVGSQHLSPYEATKLIAKVFEIPEPFIDTTTILKYYQDKALRPCKLATKNDKITRLGVHMHTFLNGLKEIKRQGTV